MSRILPAIVALFSLAGPALAADLHQGPIHPGWGIASQATVVPQANVTIVDELGSPPLPYRGFKYPLDDAGYFFPPHPAAAEPAGSGYSYGGRRVVVAPGAGGIGLPFAHVEWCHARYASYRASDNSFLPPRGQRRVCVSPYQ